MRNALGLERKKVIFIFDNFAFKMLEWQQVVGDVHFWFQDRLRLGVIAGLVTLMP